jgi:hypothetical protein
MCLWTPENSVDVSITMTLMVKNPQVALGSGNPWLPSLFDVQLLEHSKGVVLMVLRLTDYGASEEALCKP